MSRGPWGDISRPQARDQIVGLVFDVHAPNGAGYPDLNGEVRP